MSDRSRLWIFGLAVLGFAALLIGGMRGLPAFGKYRGPYGDVVNAIAVPERHITDMATAINFDIRGFDTLGEEYILFVAITGLALLLRETRTETEFTPGPDAPEQSDALRWWGLGLVGCTNLFGLYIVLHAHLTPGGGFQGGAILGTACLLVFLATDYEVFKKVRPKSWMEFADSAGAGGYTLIGLATLLISGVFLKNTLPLGKTGELLSGGTVPLINFAVGLEVSAGFVLLFSEFIEQTHRKDKEKEKPQMSLLPLAVAVWLFVIGLYGIVTSRNLIHLVVCLAVVQSSTYILLLSIGYRAGGLPPVFADKPPTTPAVDPIVQALTLTDIVVGATVTALLLALVVQSHKRNPSLDPKDLRPMQG